MKTPIFKLKTLGILVCSGILISSCSEKLLPDSTMTSEEAAFPALATTAVVDHPGRTLAANCFQCHGTNGTGLEHLAGESASEIIGEMNEMAAKNPRAEIMNAHAKAYTAAEIKLIADFFSKQK